MLKGYFSSKIIQHQCPNTHTTDASLKTHITLLYGVIFYSEPESHSLINSSIWTIMTRETGANFRWFRFNYRQRTSCASDPKISSVDESITINHIYLILNSWIQIILRILSAFGDLWVFHNECYQVFPQYRVFLYLLLSFHIQSTAMCIFMSNFWLLTLFNL